MKNKTSIERVGHWGMAIRPEGERKKVGAGDLVVAGARWRGGDDQGLDRRKIARLHEEMDPLQAAPGPSQIRRKGIEVRELGAASAGSAQSRADSAPAEISLPGDGRVIIILMVSENGCARGGYVHSAAGAAPMRSIMIDGDRGSPAIVQAVLGALADVASAPTPELVESVARALEMSGLDTSSGWRDREAADHFASLTPRQREIMDLVLAGHPNKIIAADLGISQRTVENHRASIMRKTGAKSLPALVRLALIAGRTGPLAPNSQH